MAIIVLHKDSGKYYVLLGTGYSFFKDSRPSFFGGVLLPHEEEGETMCAAVCDDQGVINWIQTSEIEVIEVNGIKIKEVLKPYVDSDLSIDQLSDSEKDNCPACGKEVSLIAVECPSCGLRLID